MNAALVSLQVRAVFMHHAGPSGVTQPIRVGMLLECRTSMELAMAALMHYDDKLS